jgi:hypothetical protein
VNQELQALLEKELQALLEHQVKVQVALPELQELLAVPE